jgi:hypothetical protein
MNREGRRRMESRAPFQDPRAIGSKLETTRRRLVAASQTSPPSHRGGCQWDDGIFLAGLGVFFFQKGASTSLNARGPQLNPLLQISTLLPPSTTQTDRSRASRSRADTILDRIRLGCYSSNRKAQRELQKFLPVPPALQVSRKPGTARVSRCYRYYSILTVRYAKQLFILTSPSQTAPLQCGGYNATPDPDWIDPRGPNTEGCSRPRTRGYALRAAKARGRRGRCASAKDKAPAGV